MGLYYPSADPALLAVLASLLPPARFIETGTSAGDSVDAAMPFFTSIETVELDDDLYEAARARFADEPSVTAHHGSSPGVLAELRSAEPTVFWLDAHWCGALLPRPPLCPLLDELAAIGELSQEQVVLIDDARLFLSPPPAPHPTEGWPTFREVIEGLAAIGPAHETLVIDDVFVLAPGALVGPLTSSLTNTQGTRCGC